MVYESKTFKICHQLTPKGKKLYEQLLEEEADKILFKHQHPIKWLMQWLMRK